MERVRHADLRRDEVGEMRAEAEGRGGRPRRRQRNATRVGQTDGHRVRARLRRHGDRDADVLRLARLKCRQSLRLRGASDDCALSISQLPDQADRSRTGRRPRAATDVGDWDHHAGLRSRVDGERGLRDLIAGVRGRLEVRAVYE